MNRTLVMGIAIFFALVGLAVLGSGVSSVDAGHRHRCHGCYGCHGCSGYSCHGCSGYACSGCSGYSCHGRRHWRHHRRHGCSGYSCSGCHGCSGGCAGCYGGEVVVPAGPPAGASPGDDTPPPAQPMAMQRNPYGFRQVSFRR